MGRKKLAETRRNPIRLLFTDSEFKLLTEVGERRKLQPRFVGRDLLLMWLNESFSSPGSIRGGTCGSLSGCRKENATWWNLRSKIWVCDDCAAQRTDPLGGAIFTQKSPNRMTSDEEDALRRQVVADNRARSARNASRTTRKSLVEAITLAARALVEFDERAESEQRSVSWAGLSVVPAVDPNDIDVYGVVDTDEDSEDSEDSSDGPAAS